MKVTIALFWRFRARFCRAPLILAATAGWTPSGPDWIADPADQLDAGFGISIASAGDVNGDGIDDLIVGATDWSGEEPGEGRAYLYLGSPNGLETDPAWVADPADKEQSRFGTDVSGVGDVNGDGFDDVVVGAPGWDSEGRTYLYLGSELGLAREPAWTADPTDQEGATFGNAVRGAGDVNGDGHADLVVGAWLWDGPGVSVVEDEGRGYLYLGGPSGLAIEPIWTADPTDLPYSMFGSAVSAAGDVNADGYGDVVVGAWWWAWSFPSTAQAEREGRAYLYLGGSSGLAEGVAWMADPADRPFAEFGIAVSAAGDVNADGFSDVLIGADLWGEGGDPRGPEGRAYLYVGSSKGLESEPAWQVDPTNIGLASFGAAVAGLGDINGDGFSDVAVGAPGWSGEAEREGRVYVYLGSESGLGASPAWVDDPTDQERALFGLSVGRAGDVNGDGFDDLAVGATGWTGEAIGEGRAFVYYGRPGSSHATAEGCACRLAGRPQSPSLPLAMAASTLLLISRRCPRRTRRPHATVPGQR